MQAMDEGFHAPEGEWVRQRFQSRTQEVGGIGFSGAAAIDKAPGGNEFNAEALAELAFCIVVARSNRPGQGIHFDFRIRSTALETASEVARTIPTTNNEVPVEIWKKCCPSMRAPTNTTITAMPAFR